MVYKIQSEKMSHLQIPNLAFQFRILFALILKSQLGFYILFSSQA